MQIGTVDSSLGHLDELVTQMLSNASADRPPSVEVVKEALIARRAEFISQQRVSELRQTVVPTGEIDAPLLDDPIRLVGFD
jgi:hypothetical protein